MVSLSNIGDVILTLPVMDALRAAWPGAELQIVIGPKARSLFDGAAGIDRVIIFDKKMTWRNAAAWVADLRRQRFDLVIDLRNSMLPFLLGARAFTWPAMVSPSRHMKDRHLARLGRFVDAAVPVKRSMITLTPAQEASLHKLINGWRGYVVVAPGAADDKKRWDVKNFIELVRYLRSKGLRVVLVGDAQDRASAGCVMGVADEGVMDLCGRTSLIELSGVIREALLAVTNDSGIMHLASYLDKPVVALFGPTDPLLYGPWSSKSSAIRKGPGMAAIGVHDVISEVDRLL